MIRLLIPLGILSLILIGVSSCREYFPTSPVIAGEVILATNDLDSLYHATENMPLTVGFDVKLTDAVGSPIVGIPISAELITDTGSLAIPEFISNEDGVMHGLYYNHKPLNNYNVQLQFAADGDILTKFFTVKVRPQPAAIIADPEHQFLFAATNKQIETSVAYRITNAQGVPVPYADVAFRILKGKAAIESVAYADINGLVRAYMTLSPVENCQIVVQAEVRFVELKPQGQIKRWVSLNLVKNIPQLKQKHTRRILKAESTISVIVD